MLEGTYVIPVVDGPLNRAQNKSNNLDTTMKKKQEKRSTSVASSTPGGLEKVDLEAIANDAEEVMSPGSPEERDKILAQDKELFSLTTPLFDDVSNAPAP